MNQTQKKTVTVVHENSFCEHCHISVAVIQCCWCSGPTQEPFYYCQPCSDVVHTGNRKSSHPLSELVNIEDIKKELQSDLDTITSYNEKDQQGIQITEEEVSKINERYEDMVAECEYVFNDLLTILSNKKVEILSTCELIKEKKMKLFRQQLESLKIRTASTQLLMDEVVGVLDLPPEELAQKTAKLSSQLKDTRSNFDNDEQAVPKPLPLRQLLSFFPDTTIMKKMITEYCVPYREECIEGETILVTATAQTIDSRGYFWLCEETSPTVMNHLHLISHTLTVQNSSQMKKSKISVSPGMLCAAYYPIDQLWHRALVEGVNEVEKISVRFLDYGDVMDLFPDQIGQLPDELITYPFRCLQCRFTDDPSINWNYREPKWKYNDLVNGHNLTATILKKVCCPESPMTLFTVQLFNSSMCDVGQEVMLMAQKIASSKNKESCPVSSQEVRISNITPANFIRPLKPLSSSVLSYNEVTGWLSPTNPAPTLAMPTTSLQDHSNYGSDMLLDTRLEVKDQIIEKAQSSHVVELVTKTTTNDDLEIVSDEKDELIYLSASTMEGPGSEVLKDKGQPLSSKVLPENELCEDLNSTEHTVTVTSPQPHPSSSNSSKVSSPSLSQQTHSLSSTLSSPLDHAYQLKFTTRDKTGDKQEETDSDIQMTSDADQESEHQSQRKQLRRPLSQRTQVLVANESDTPVESDSALTIDETPLPNEDIVDTQLSHKVSSSPPVKKNNSPPSDNMPCLPDHTSIVHKSAPKLTLELSAILQGTDEEDVGGVLPDSHPTLHPVVVKDAKLSLCINSCLNESGIFWCQLVLDDQETKLYSDLFEKLQDHAATKGQYTPVFFAPGDVCMAIFSEDNQWYRGVVEDIGDEKDLYIRFVDYGNEELVPLTSVMPLKSEFKKLPFQAIQCCLYCQTKDAFTSEECQRFDDVFIDDNTVTAKVISVCDGVVLVKVDLPNGQGDLVEKIVSSDSSFKLRTYSFDMPPDDDNEQGLTWAERTESPTNILQDGAFHSDSDVFLPKKKDSTRGGLETDIEDREISEVKHEYRRVIKPNMSHQANVTPTSSIEKHSFHPQSFKPSVQSPRFRPSFDASCVTKFLGAEKEDKSSFTKRASRKSTEYFDRKARDHTRKKSDHSKQTEDTSEDWETDAHFKRQPSHINPPPGFSHSAPQIGKRLKRIPFNTNKDDDVISLFVRKVPESYSTKDVAHGFQCYGKVYDVRKHENKFGVMFFVDMERSCALKAMKALQGYSLSSDGVGMDIKVDRFQRRYHY